MLLNELQPTIDDFKDKGVPINNTMQWEQLKPWIAGLVWDWYSKQDPQREIYTFHRWMISYTLRVGNIAPLLQIIFGPES